MEVGDRVTNLEGVTADLPVQVFNNDPQNPILYANAVQPLALDVNYLRLISSRIPHQGLEYWIDAADPSGVTFEEAFPSTQPTGHFFIHQDTWTTWRNDGTFDRPYWTTVNLVGADDTDPRGAVSGAVDDFYVALDGGGGFVGAFVNIDGGTGWQSVPSQNMNLSNVSPTNGGRVILIPNRTVTEKQGMVYAGPGKGPALLTRGGGAYGGFKTGINGRPALHFDNDSGDFYSIYAGTGFGFLFGQCTVFMVADVHGPSTASASMEYFHSNAIVAQAWEDTGQDGPGTTLAGGGGFPAQILSPAQHNDGPHLIRWDVAPGDGDPALRLFKSYDGGSPEGGNTRSDAPASMPYDDIQLDPMAGYYRGALGELIMYSRLLSFPEIAAVESYLTAKWGL